MITKRQRRLAAQKEMKQPQGLFVEVDFAQMKAAPKWMTRCFRNHKYIVMIMDGCLTTQGNAVRAMIQKHDDLPILNHWSEIQRIKNEIFGKEVMAIEYYPPESELENEHNIYWIWIFPDGVIPKRL